MNEPSSPQGQTAQTLAAMSSPVGSPGGGGGGGGGGNAVSPTSAASQQQKQQQHQQKAVNVLQWTNLTRFPYQRDIGRVSEKLGLSRRFSHLQDRVIFFRPAVRRRCPNGIMTDRVAFITPNGLLHLCDNDAAPKRTLALPDLLSIVTDSASQIALITDWPLVLRFETPKYASQETMGLPGLKMLLQIALFFKPEASLLRSTPEDFGAINLNLGKPRQFRAPASFDVLAPPPDKPISELLDQQQQQQQQQGGFPKSGPGSPQQQQQQGGGTPSGSVRRGVQLPDRPPIVAPYMPGENPGSLSPQLQSIVKASGGNLAGSPSSGGGGGFGAGGGGEPAMLRWPDPPKGPTDFAAIQQNALFDMYAKRDSDQSAAALDPTTGRLGGKRDLRSDKASEQLERKMEDRERRMQRLRDEHEAAAEKEGASKSRAAEAAVTGAARRQQLLQQQKQQQIQMDPTSPTAPMFYQRQLEAGMAAPPSQYQQQYSSISPQQHQNRQFSPSDNSGAGPRPLQFSPNSFDQYTLPPAAVARSSAGHFDPAFGAPVGPYDVIHDHEFFHELPERFAGKTVEEVRGAVEVVERLERANEELRREVLELQLREKTLRAAPIPLGRVVPVEAALSGAAVRNLGVLVVAICRRRKLLGQFEMLNEAQQNLMHAQSADLNAQNMSRKTPPKTPPPTPGNNNKGRGAGGAVNHDDI